MGLNKLAISVIFRAQSRVQTIPLFQRVWEGYLRLKDSKAIQPKLSALAVSSLKYGDVEERTLGHSPLVVGTKKLNIRHPFGLS